MTNKLRNVCFNDDQITLTGGTNNYEFNWPGNNGIKRQTYAAGLADALFVITVFTAHI
jgi:hypothetical protein